MKLYVSGKMRGEPDNGFPLFRKVTADLRAQGHEVIDPSENPEQPDWESYMVLDLQYVCQVEGVVVLHNWRNSPGARMEVFTARLLNKKIMNPDLTPHEVEFEDLKIILKESILEEADRLVNVDRQSTYGHPMDDFNRTVGMINAAFAHKIAVPFLPEDWALMMVLAKVSREINKPKRDNRTDIAGYIKTKELIEQRREEERKAYKAYYAMEQRLSQAVDDILDRTENASH